MELEELKNLTMEDIDKLDLMEIETLNDEIKGSFEKMLLIVERIAKLRYDGHFTLFRFTTNWVFMFGTPHKFYLEQTNLLII